MKFCDILSADKIVVDLHATTAAQAIDELIRMLALSGSLDAAHEQSLAASVKKRESTMTTGIGYNVAIPHAHTDLLSEPLALFAKSVKGIEFNSLDGQPVHFLTLLLVPTAQRQAHLHTLACIARLLQSKETRDAIYAAADAAAIFSIIQERSSGKVLA